MLDVLVVRSLKRWSGGCTGINLLGVLCSFFLDFVAFFFFIHLHGVNGWHADAARILKLEGGSVYFLRRRSSSNLLAYRIIFSCLVGQSGSSAVVVYRSSLCPCCRSGFDVSHSSDKLELGMDACFALLALLGN
ncbi:hypothetical protein B0H63DRAFT_51603 [Podospora didyma]|uniref:Uncharacterized protein n=1 Tax=Podospora didyma TaxID=330526 RepID=A0AAE0U8E2_9PEZI|nr:hypothetical protein B0H63DRAFT_51603 [Podospora didyma]